MLCQARLLLHFNLPIDEPFLSSMSFEAESELDIDPGDYRVLIRYGVVLWKIGVGRAGKGGGFIVGSILVQAWS